MANSINRGGLFVKYICRNIPTENKFIYNKFCYMTTFYSYERSMLRDRMKKPFFKDEKQKYDDVSHYANKLARNLDFNPVKWEMIVSKSKQVYKDFKPVDIALLLNSLSRARFYDAELFNLLVPQIIKNIPFFTSVYISMVLSAYSKGKLLSPELYGVIKSEISSRMYEFTTSVEMCMIINAISKYGESDKAFLDKICRHLVKVYSGFHFTPQELSVLINAFVTLGYYNEQLFNLMSKNLVGHLRMCNIYELIRVLNGYIIFENDSNHIQTCCKNEIINKIKYSSQSELTTTLYSLGSINYTLVQTNIELNRSIIDEIVAAIKIRCLSLLDGFTASNLSHFVISSSKWLFKLETDELMSIVRQLSKLKLDLNLVELNNTLVAIMKLYCSVNDLNDFNDIKEDNRPLLLEIQNLMKTWSNSILGTLDEANHDLNGLIKILDSYSKFKVYDEALFNKIKNIIVVNHLSELNKSNGYTLNEIFTRNKGYTKHDDFSEILNELIN